MSGPLIAIVGASGNQGGSVVKALAGSNYKLRLLTRNPSTFKNAPQNAEVVKCDINNQEDLDNAFKNAEIVMAITQFWTPEVLSNVEQEIVQGKMMADAAKKNDVKHFIFSSLPHVAKISNGKYSHVHHFDNKAKVEEYIKSIGLPATFVNPGIFMQNYLAEFGGVMKGPDGKIMFMAPVPKETVVPVVDIVKDYGQVVAHVLKNKDKYLGKTINVAGEYITYENLVKTFTKVTGKDAIFIQVPKDDFIKSAGPHGQEIYEMFAFFHDYGYYNGADISEAKKIHPSISTFEQWLKDSKWAGPA